jgi:hypothetical protein
VDVFRKTYAESLTSHRPIDNPIDLDPGFKIPYGRIDNLSEFEPETLKVFIETTLANGFIQWSSSSAAAPIFFAKKNDGGQRLCVDYWAQNSAKIKNR